MKQTSVVLYGLAAAMVQVQHAAAQAGVANNASRTDHRHDALGDATPSTQAFGDAAVVGTTTSSVHADHKHAMPVGGLSLEAAMAADITYNLSTALTNLTGLAAAIAASETHEYDVEIYLTAGAGAFRVDVTGPAAPTSVLITGLGLDNSGLGSVAVAAAFSTALVFTLPTNTPQVLRLRIRVVNGVNAGTIQVRGAQAAASAANTVFKAGSHLRDFRAA